VLVRLALVRIAQPMARAQGSAAMRIVNGFVCRRKRSLAPGRGECP
jgi:hypothetical protein